MTNPDLLGARSPAAAAHLRSLRREAVSAVSQRFGAPVRRAAQERHSPLWRGWRLIGMPIFYPLFALGCLVGLLGALAFRAAYRDPQQRVRANRRLLSALIRRWLWFGCVLRLLEWEAVAISESADEESNRAATAQASSATALAEEAAAGAPGRLLVANHPTLIDVLFMVALEPDLCCVLKADLKRNWAFAALIRELDYLSNADPERLLEEGAMRLAKGETLLVFPEGTRTVPGEPVRFRQGAAAIALRAGARVQPVVIQYHGVYLSKGYPWYALPPQRMRYRFCYEAPMDRPQPLPGATAAQRHERRRARRALNAELERIVNAGLAASPLPVISAPPPGDRAAPVEPRDPLAELRSADL